MTLTVCHQKQGKYSYYVLRDSWRDQGKVWHRHIKQLGNNETKARKSLAALLQAGAITKDDYDRLSLRFDTDIWGTPDLVLDLCREVMGAIDLDTCTMPSNPTRATRFYTIANDGLAQDWHGRIYMNPPYSKPQPWIEKLVSEYQSGNVEQAIILVKSGTFQNKGTAPLIQTATVKGGWKGRLNFKPLRKGRKAKSPDFDVSIAYWGCNGESCRAVFAPYVWL